MSRREPASERRRAAGPDGRQTWRKGSAWLHLLLLFAVGMVAACGKKGPPLAPFPRLPRSPGEFSARRLGSQVYVRFKVPEQDIDGQRPANIELIEVYAMTGSPRTIEDFLEVGTLVASVMVRRPPPPPPPPESPGMPPPPPPPPLPLEPGVDQGAVIVVSEALTPEMATPVLTKAELRRLEDAELPEPAPPPVVRSPLVSMAEKPPVMRYYVAVGVNRRGRRGNMSSRAGVPLSNPPVTPAPPTVTYTAEALTVTWVPPSTARRAIQEPVRAVVTEAPVQQGAVPAATSPGAPATAAPETQGAVTAPVATPGAPPPVVAPGVPPRPATPGAPQVAAPGTPPQIRAPGAPAEVSAVGSPLPIPELLSRPWYPVAPPSRYNVYDVTPLDAQAGAPPVTPSPVGAAPTAAGTVVVGDPAVVEAPFPIHQAPIDDVSHTVRTVEFGVERCYAVRMVDSVAGTDLESEASSPTCVKIIDTFAPRPPASLAAVAGEGVISLIWEARNEADLLGYVILRGEGAGATLQPLTPAPIKETTYRDETVRPGVRYVYAVKAIDTATPANVSVESNRVQDTAR